MTETYLNKYNDFVNEVTSDASRDNAVFIARMQDLNAKGVNISRLLTGGVGLAAEGGEFLDIVKKIAFQGKELDEEVAYKLKRELGDVMWYFANACMALNLDPYDVLDENIDKLQSRYPGGKFSIARSETREKGDV